jgi:hypothetical protein
VVLGLLRNALGVQQVPPNMVLNGIAIIVSAYIMAPLVMDSYDKMKDQGFAPSSAGQIGQVIEIAKEPVRKFLDKHAQAREKAFFLKSAAAVWPPERARALKADDLIVLAPAFTLSELTAAFKIGFLLYLARRRRPDHREHPARARPVAGDADAGGDPVQAVAVRGHGRLVDADPRPGADLQVASVQAWTTTTSFD